MRDDFQSLSDADRPERRNHSTVHLSHLFILQYSSCCGLWCRLIIPFTLKSLKICKGREYFWRKRLEKNSFGLYFNCRSTSNFTSGVTAPLLPKIEYAGYEGSKLFVGDGIEFAAVNKIGASFLAARTDPAKASG